MLPSSAQANDESEADQQILSLWNMLSPPEAIELKFIVLDEEGRFAGEYTADDQHGDRYFIIKEKPRSGGWSMASNLTTHFSSNVESLPKTTQSSIKEFREIINKAVYRYEQASSSNARLSPISDKKPLPLNYLAINERLTGLALIQHVKELGDLPPQTLAKACGYVTNSKGEELGDVNAYYNALFDAHSHKK
jgi:hypothetical protein